MRIKQFEEEALAYLLAGNQGLFKALRKQMKAATVSRRQRTANGILTFFKVPETVDRLKRQPIEFCVHDVIAATNVGTAFDFTLQVKRGVIHYLRAYAYTDFRPQGAEQLRFSYLREKPAGSGCLYESESRDWDYVKRMIDVYHANS